MNLPESSSTNRIMNESLAEKLETLRKEYEKKKRKLKKCRRAASAKAHVKKKLLEQNILHESETDESFTKDDEKTFLSNSQCERPISFHGDHTMRLQSTVQSTSDLNEKSEADICCEKSTRSPISNIPNKNSSHQGSSCAISNSGKRALPSEDGALNCSIENKNDKTMKISNKIDKISKYMKKNNVIKIENKTAQSIKTDVFNQTCSKGIISSDKELYRQEQGDVRDIHDAIICEMKIQCEDANKNAHIKDNINQNSHHKTESNIGQGCDEILNVANARKTIQTSSAFTCDIEKSNSSSHTCVDKALRAEGSDKSDPSVHNTLSSQDKSDSLVLGAISTQNNSDSSVFNAHASFLQDKSESSVPNSLSSPIEDLFDSQLSELGSTTRKTKRGKRKSAGGSRQRQSARLAELPSQDYSTSSSQSDKQDNSPRFLDGSSKKMKTKVIISSMFQCLIDEGKRKGSEDFNIPCEFKEKISRDTDKILEETVNCLQDFKTENVVHKSSTGKPDLIEKNVEEVGMSEEEMHVKDEDDCLTFPPANRNDDGNQSPTLFESQNFTDIHPVLDLNENLESIIPVCKNVDSEDIDENDPLEAENAKNVDVENRMDSDDDDDDDTTTAGEVHLDQIASFQIPEADTLLGLEAITVQQQGDKCVYVACLCTTNLKLYQWDNETWHCIRTIKHVTVLRKNCVFSLHSWSGIPDLHLVLSLSRSDGTVLTHYTLTDTDLKQKQMDHIETKGVCSCTLTCGQFIVARWTGSKTELTKYSMDLLTGHWIHTDLETCLDKIVSMAMIKQKPMAVAGFSNQGMLQIWNHECGFMLSTVDLYDVCPRDFTCPVIYHEEGFLFLPLFNKKKGTEAGSIVVVNPQMGTSETLVSLQVKDQTWTGCSKAFLLQADFLVTKETNGRFSVLDLYKGHPLATLDDAKITSLSCTDNFLFLAHKQCIHVYKTG